MRSRVTPGTSCTTASRRPSTRLTRVDLPTLGRPTIATTGSGPLPPGPAPPPSPERAVPAPPGPQGAGRVGLLLAHATSIRLARGGSAPPPLHQPHDRRDG